MVSSEPRNTAIGHDGVHRTRAAHPSSSKVEVSYRSKIEVFETVALAILTNLAQWYKVGPRPKFAGEPFEELKEIHSQLRES